MKTKPTKPQAAHKMDFCLNCALNFTGALSTEWKDATGISLCPLHAAAPDLLAALEALIASDFEGFEAEKMARAAVAAAKGA